MYWFKDILVKFHEIIEAGLKLKVAGIETSQYFLVGIGGRERSAEHAVNSARVLNAFSPDFIRLRTLVLEPGSPLYDDYQNGTFQLLRPHEALAEIRLLIENLECENSLLLSDHVSNYSNINGRLPHDRKFMIKTLGYYLAIKESEFRSPSLYPL